MRFFLPWLRAYVRLPETAQALARLLTEHSFETTVVRAETGEVLLDADILPNRAADCLSHLGLARELGALLGRKVTWPPLRLPRTTRRFPLSVRVQDRTACPRFFVAIMEGLQGSAPAPDWMQHRLRALGVQPQNLIVDVTNYVLWDVGHPTHAFDARVVGNSLGVRGSRKGESLLTLDGVARALPEGTLVLTGDDRPLDVAGIKGGAESGVRPDTARMVLTAALFDRAAIRKASRALNLRTEASDRFVKGRTAATVAAGAARVLQLLQELGGGKLVAWHDVYPRRAETRAVLFSPTDVNAVLGMTVPVRTQKNMLTALGFQVSGTKKTLRVLPPLFRTDVARPEDVAEEIGRLVGLAKIPRIIPRAPLHPAALPDDVALTRAFQDLLKSSGWTETLSYSFSPEKETTSLGLDRVKHLTVVNPLQPDHRRLRVSLLPNLIRQARAGIKKVPLLRLYEIGRVYLPHAEAVDGKALRRRDTRWQEGEPTRLTGLLARRGAVATRKQQQDFYDTKGIIEHLLSQVGLSEARFDAAEPSAHDRRLSFWQPGQGAVVRVGAGENAESVGLVGVVSPATVEQVGIQGSLIAFDIDVSKIIEVEKALRVYIPPLPYPTVLRDLSLLMPDDVLVDTVREAIRREGAPVVQDVAFLDLYDGDDLPPGRRSVTLRVTYGSPARTLRDTDVNAVHERMVNHLQDNFGMEVRA